MTTGRATSVSLLLKYWLPFFFWAALIFLFSSIPDLSTGLSCEWLLRKTAHITEFLVFAFLFHRAMSASLAGVAPAITLICTALVSLLYAALDELHQSLVPGRIGTWTDVAIDSTGVLIFFILLAAAGKFRRSARP